MDFSFHKYQGTGNDFILADGRKPHFPVSRDLVARLCDRRFGIGADGLIILENAEGYDFRMTYFNSDGLESTMCGNGGRCIVAFADFLSLIRDKCRFLAVDGPHDAEILSRKGEEYQVKLKMGDVSKVDHWNEDMVINTGSPHLLRFTEDAGGMDIIGVARPVRYHRDFHPGGINVNFIQVKGGSLFVRTYERGVEDETLSCGTGVTAAALAHATSRGLDAGITPIETPGGNLKVHFKRYPGGGFSDIWLEGPAVRVFSGTVDLNEI